MLVVLSGKVFCIVGTAGWPAAFLSSGYGARPLALAGAFTADTDDATVPYWNPAGIAFEDKMALSSMVSWMATTDMTSNFFNFIYPSNAGNFALNWINFGIGGIEARQTDTSSYTLVSDSENAFFGTYAKSFTKWFSLGGNVKVISSNLVGTPAFGMSCDLGAIIKPSEMVQFGVMLQDMLNFLNWGTGTTEHIPLDLKLGTEVQALPGIISVFADFDENQYDITASAGAEANILKIFFLRAGGYYDLTSYESNYTLGGGIKYQIAGFLAQLDYAFLSQLILGQEEFNHKLSLAVYF